MSVENKMYNSERKENAKSVNGSETYIAAAHINSLSKKYNSLNSRLSPERKNGLLNSLRNNFPTFIDLASSGWNIAKQTGDATAHMLTSRPKTNVIKASDYTDEINNAANSVLQQTELQIETPSEPRRKADIHSRTTLPNSKFDLYGQGFNMIPNKRPMYKESITKRDNNQNEPVNKQAIPNKPGAMPTKEELHISDAELEQHVIIKPKNPTSETFQTREELITDLNNKGIKRIADSVLPSNQQQEKPKKVGFLGGILRGLEKRNEKKEQMLELASQLKELQQLTLHQLNYNKQHTDGLLEDKSTKIVHLYNKLQTEMNSSVSKEAVDIKITLSQVKEALVKAEFAFSKLGTAIAPNNKGFQTYESHENFIAGLTKVETSDAKERNRTKNLNKEAELEKQYEQQAAKQYLFDNSFVENDMATSFQNLEGKLNSFRNIPQTSTELSVMQEFIDENFATLKNSYNEGVLLFSVEPNDETQLKYNPNTKHFERGVANNLLDIPKNYKTEQGAYIAVELLKKLNNTLTYTVKPKQNKFEIVVIDQTIQVEGFDDRSYR